MSSTRRKAIDEMERRPIRSSRYTVLLIHSAEDAEDAEGIKSKIEALGAEVLVQTRGKMGEESWNRLLAEIRKEASSSSGVDKERSALSLRGALSPQEAEELREEARRLRASWR